jgi:FdhE protein
VTAQAPLPAAAARTGERWQQRRRRAAKLAEQLPYAVEVLHLYGRLLEVQEPAWARALADRPAMAQLPEYIVRRVAPGVVAVARSAGPATLAAAAEPWLRERALLDVSHWLAGELPPPTGAFFARASTQPVLEALAGCGALPPVAAADPPHCPRCGGLPQFAFTAGGGDPLVTAPMRLCCARCSESWQGARLRCAACGESSTAALCSFAADAQLPHLRADACTSCRSYLVHVDLRREPAAVPEVDELAALPLDLHVQEQGYGKIVSNLMGIG